MTYQDDPKPKLRPLDPVRQNPIRTSDKDNTGMWIAGLIGLCLVLALVVWGVSRNTSGTAITNTRPATTTTTTTGSGAAPSAIPNNPSGTTPQRDTNQPAPASPNR